ncbi:MAG: AAA family ATPase [Burkholderiaceae bacterium]|nr:AAA family ATPase [Burkholderiaceae bacterium]
MQTDRSFQVRAAEAPRDRISRAIEVVESGLIEREDHARVLVLAALCGEHLLLIGPPGTAKSELARRLHRIFGGRYFERLLTRFSVPEELFGPLSLAALDEGRYERDIAGYLPDATIGFLDEVFKGNSAILNALLTLLNERVFDQGSERVETPLISLVAASNELPHEDTLKAFEDRFLFRYPVAAVADDHFAELLAIDPDRAAPSGEAILDRNGVAHVATLARNVPLTGAVRDALLALRVEMRERGIEISDRRWVRATRALRIAASTNGGVRVELTDLWILKAILALDAEQADRLESWYCDCIGAAEVVDPQRCARIVQAFEKQLELERSATELAFDDAGKLSLMRRRSTEDGSDLGDSAPRISAFSRGRRYSATHVAARLSQIDDVVRQFDGYLHAAKEHSTSVEARLAAHLWVPARVAQRVADVLAATAARVTELRSVLMQVREGYFGLPLTEDDNDVAPNPVQILD